MITDRAKHRRLYSNADAIRKLRRAIDMLEANPESDVVVRADNSVADNAMSGGVPSPFGSPFMQDGPDPVIVIPARLCVQPDF